MHAPCPPERRRFITSVLVPDRVGLLRDVTRSVFSLEGNIGGIRQTVVDGFFNLVFTSEHPSQITPEALRALLDSTLESEAVVTVLDSPEVVPTAVPQGARFVVTTRGADKPGTIFTITSFLVDHNINIEDWMVEEEDGKIVYIAQVVVPETEDFRLLQEAFRDAMATHGLTALLCHENIFRATNEIGPIKALIEETPNAKATPMPSCERSGK